MVYLHSITVATVGQVLYETSRSMEYIYHPLVESRYTCIFLQDLNAHYLC